MVTTFEGVGSQWPTSEQIRADYAASDEKIILSFSRGKDSLAAWLAMLDSGIKPDNITPVYYYRVPGLKFDEDSIKYFEDFFQCHIMRVPHPSFLQMWNDGVYQPPTRTGLIDACEMPSPTYQEIEDLIRVDQGLPPDTCVATGVRAADSIARRTFLKRSGPFTIGKKRVAIIWDWTKGECYDYIESHGAKLPIDYEWFDTGRYRSGRTFDGLAAQFLGPIRDNAPEDYQTILEWFPLADLDLFRHEVLMKEEAK